jgi:hypothetical protein
MSGDLKSEGAAIDVQNLSFTGEDIKEVIASGEFTGPFHTALAEAVPIYDQAPCETVMAGDNNSFVILGRDRPYSFGSGKGAYGGKCGRIHLIAGLSSAYKKTSDQLLTGPNLITDAATVYISQRANIDEYFGLPLGSNKSADDLSAVALKADHIRIIGREHVKIYAGPMLNSSLKGETNSKGGDIISRGKIDLIAGDYENLQPAVKGNDLKEYLGTLTSIISDMVSGMDDLNDRMIKINNALLLHTHPVTGIGIAIAAPAPTLAFAVGRDYPKAFKSSINNLLNQFNLIIQEINFGDYDERLPILGKKNFLSDSVNIT